MKIIKTLILVFVALPLSAQSEHWRTYNCSNSGLTHNWILSLAIDRNEVIWIGTSGGGMSSFDGLNWKRYGILNSEIPGSHIRSIIVDDNNHKWIGTTSGLAKLDDSNPENENWEIFTKKNSNIHEVRCTPKTGQ